MKQRDPFKVSFAVNGLAPRRPKLRKDFPFFIEQWDHPFGDVLVVAGSET